MTCQCEVAGFCQRFNREMRGRLQEICRGEKIDPKMQAKYVRKWSIEATGQEYACRQASPEEVLLGKVVVEESSGAGTELKRLLRSYGIRPAAGCKCNQRAKLMDERGTKWCRENIETIVGWLKEEAMQRTVSSIAWSDRLGRWFAVTAIRRARLAQLHQK